MIKATPMKRSHALVKFSKDHHFALLLIWKIRQGLRFNVEIDRITKYLIFFFENYLKEHFTEEEELLFVHLNADSMSRKVVEQDHQALKEMAEQIKSHPDTTVITEFVNTLEKHIRFEERELFNELQTLLNEAELNVIDEKMKTSHPVDTEDNWKDPFWVKN